MKNIALSYHHPKGLAFPFGLSGDTECTGESPLVRHVGAGGTTSASMNPDLLWLGPTNGNMTPHALYESITSLHAPYPGQQHIKNIRGIGNMQNVTPNDGHIYCGSSDMNDTVVPFPSYGVLNAGALVLDSSKGELVNALKMTSKEILEAKALAASKSHSEAERRRRERINSHLATLRTIVPSSTKSDKASLLAQVIDQVKRLKRQVSDVYQHDSMPSESDELVVEADRASMNGRIMIRAALCCDDRPDLMTDLKHALDSLKLRTVKVDMSTLGGRIRNEFVVAPKERSDVEQDVELLIKRVQEVLRLVMERPGRGELLQGRFTKRQRLATFEGQVDS